jgi:hypothetical protein
VIGWLVRKNWLPVRTRVAVAVLTVAVFGSGIVLAQQTAAPYYSLFQNAVGARVNADTTFSEETYDYGVREAVDRIAAVASPSAVIASDAPAVVAHYLRGRSRQDIRVESLSVDGIDVHAREAWVIVQDEHLTFENQRLVGQLRAREAPWTEIRIGDRVAAQIFRVGRQ